MVAGVRLVRVRVRWVPVRCTTVVVHTVVAVVVVVAPAMHKTLPKAAV